MIRSPIYRLEKWISALRTLVACPRVLLGVEVVALTLWAEKYQRNLTRFIRHRTMIAVDEGATTPALSTAHPHLQWFTAYEIGSESTWAMNTYDITREKISALQETDRSWFVGQPLTGTTGNEARSLFGSCFYGNREVRGV